MKINSSEIINNSKKSLVNLATQLDTVEILAFHEFILHSTDFRNMTIFKEVIKLPKTTSPIIYTIEMLDIEIKNNLIKKFIDFSPINKTKNFEKVRHSKHNDNVLDSKFLYVGSSITDFSSRLKNHLGLKGHTTYALHLSKWDENMTYNIKIKMYEIKHINDSEINRNLVEIIEQQIWDTLKPVFGKRSGLL
ncbi:hypothetical protein [Flavobacterium terrigena]|uniref:GIY-YIG domain-containing protein n=1 Tax=Flavobacterium terrigena TaxID=402734 RepID=A0A1H6QL28_9FLAO|nr:hypothetical protein [Flavobacterium terrigena]SEI42676.1 hypothetical protein SAMN05660918_0502 [Flavobacterium terrigena]